MLHLTIPGRYESLADIRAFVAQAAEQAGLGERAVYAVRLAVDEACTNIIEHAYGGEGRGEIECTCVIKPQGLTIILRDRGKPFAPDSIPPPDLSLPIEELPLRGAGLHLIRKLMDEVTFRFSEEGNELTLVKYR